MEKLQFTKDHEWVKVEGNKAYIGITDYAQKALGDIVFVELPEIGAELGAGDVVGTVESVKTVSDVFTPVGGKVTEVNTGLEDEPGKINGAPYENWIAALEFDGGEISGMMNEDDYKKYCEEEN